MLSIWLIFLNLYHFKYLPNYLKCILQCMFQGGFFHFHIRGFTQGQISTHYILHNHKLLQIIVSYRLHKTYKYLVKLYRMFYNVPHSQKHKFFYYNLHSFIKFHHYINPLKHKFLFPFSYKSPSNIRNIRYSRYLKGMKLYN